jgi:carbon storage regulator
MLVLSRNKGERIVIGGNIVLTVVDVRGDRVRLGFTGPTDVPIHREEVFQRLCEEDRAAAARAQEACSCL